ncbi:site-specific DNA-methyltransferase [Candidatus Sumerlaeota bacterium]|nr:site-specific DNA-methyltransferase [Candidatus Sumerlaeota bacterium]MBI3735100.1 site-specific DNA-methyltransferase [Candidatus Sumerlaeota bacterium]
MKDAHLIQGNCLEEIKRLENHSIHAVCTDPPYGLVEFSSGEVAKLRAGRGGVWRLPPKLNGCERRPLPRFTVLSLEQKREMEVFFKQWAAALRPKLRPGAHVLIAGNATLQMHVQNAMVGEEFENRATILRLYHGFRGGDRPKNAEKEFPEVCVTPRGNYEPWMLFRKPISEKTVAQNLRKWGTGGLRMLEGGKPLPDVIPSFKTPAREREIADHPSLKPQHLLRIFVRALLPYDKGLLLDPFMGSGSTLAAASALGVKSIGMEIDPEYFDLAQKAIPQLARLYPAMKGTSLSYSEGYEKADEFREQLLLLESEKRYRKK